MGTIWKILRRAGVVIGPLMFVGSVALAAREIAEWGLSWYWWAAIGGGIFFTSGFAIIWGQHRENARLQEQLNGQVDATTIRKLFSIENLGYDFDQEGTLRIDVGLTVTPTMLVESVRLDIEDKSIQSDWGPRSIGGLPERHYVYFDVPDWVTPTEHTVRLVAFAEGMKTESKPFIIAFGQPKNE